MLLGSFPIPVIDEDILASSRTQCPAEKGPSKDLRKGDVAFD